MALGKTVLPPSRRLLCDLSPLLCAAMTGALLTHISSVPVQMAGPLRLLALLLVGSTTLKVVGDQLRRRKLLLPSLYAGASIHLIGC